MGAGSSPNTLDVLDAYAAIGHYVVTAGHLEATCCRLLEWLNHNPNPGSITFSRNLGWAALLKQLRRDAREAQIGDRVEEIFTAHELEKCLALRHNLIHGAVDVSQAPAIAIIRHGRGTNEGALHLGGREMIQQYADHVRAMTRALDRLLPEEYRRVRENLVAGVVGMTSEQADKVWPGWRDWPPGTNPHLPS